MITSLLLSTLAVLPKTSNTTEMFVVPTEPSRAAVSYPWAFERGNETSRTTAMAAIDDIAKRAEYSSVSREVAMEAWRKNNDEPKFGKAPSRQSLIAFGREMNAARVLYGSVSWHTRSIWVNAGPKTISTATVTAHVLDTQSGKVVYSRSRTLGRSDERSSNLKIAAAVLFTPLVTAVTGGPATPREERAVQIALALAYKPWVDKARTKN